MSYAALFAVAGDFGGRMVRRRRKQRVNGLGSLVFIRLIERQGSYPLPRFDRHPARSVP